MAAGNYFDTMNTLLTESEIKRHLRTRTQEEWLNVIMQFRGNLRTRLAAIIWWDYYGVRESKARWNNLDAFVNAPYIECDKGKMRNALIKAGYSETMATERIFSTSETRLVILK